MDCAMIRFTVQKHLSHTSFADYPVVINHMRVFFSWIFLNCLEYKDNVDHAAGLVSNITGRQVPPESVTPQDIFYLRALRNELISIYKDMLKI